MDFLDRLNQKRKPRTSKRAPTVPPTTPPIMAAFLLEPPAKKMKMRLVYHTHIYSTTNNIIRGPITI